MASEVPGLRSRSIPMRVIRGDLGERSNSTDARATRILTANVQATPVGGELTGTVGNASVTVGGDLTGPITAATVVSLRGTRGLGNGTLAALVFPWMSGDTAQTVFVGSSDASNNQMALQAVSYTNTALKGLTYGNTNGVAAVAGYNNGDGVGGYFSSVDSHGVEAYSVNGRCLTATRNTSGATTPVVEIYQQHASNAQYAFYVRQAGETFGVYALHEKTDTIYPAVYGRNNGDGPGVSGANYGDGNGIDGIAHGDGIGVVALTDGTSSAFRAYRNVETNGDAVAVFEQQHASNDAYVIQVLQSGTGGGIYVLTDAVAGVISLADSGVGVQAESTSGNGVQGLSATGTAGHFTNTAGVQPAVYGIIDSRNGDYGTAAGAALNGVVQSDATAAARTVALFDHYTVNAATVASSFAADLITRLSNDNDELTNVVRERIAWDDPTDGSEDGDWSIAVIRAGALSTGIEIKGLTGGLGIGFLGAGPITRPTLAAPAGPTYGGPEQTLLNDIRNALINLGLCQ